MRAVTAEEVAAAARATLFGPPDTAGEAIDDAFLAASLRRLAGSLCPCPPRTLVSRLSQGLRGLPRAAGDDDELEQRVEDVLELLVAGGDLLELAQVGTAAEGLEGRLLFAAPPGFVPLAGGAVVLVGLTPDDPTPLPALLQGRAQSRGALRLLLPDAAFDIAAVLGGAGWRRISREAWLRCPPRQDAAAHVAFLEDKLSMAPPGSSIDEMRVLDPELPPSFYRGRWAAPGGLRAGRFVCRRPQAYGADLWCYAELRAGRAERLLDLPLPGSRLRGCDEALRLQFALDCVRGTPQAYRATASGAATATFQLSSPLPAWGQRHLALNGRRTRPNRGFLFAWDVEPAAVPELESLLQRDLWLVRAGGDGA